MKIAMFKETEGPPTRISIWVMAYTGKDETPVDPVSMNVMIGL